MDGNFHEVALESRQESVRLACYTVTQPALAKPDSIAMNSVIDSNPHQKQGDK
jgi:hypothetical protein